MNDSLASASPSYAELVNQCVSSKLSLGRDINPYYLRLYYRGPFSSIDNKKFFVDVSVSHHPPLSPPRSAVWLSILEGSTTYLTFCVNVSNDATPYWYPVRDVHTVFFPGLAIQQVDAVSSSAVPPSAVTEHRYFPGAPLLGQTTFTLPVVPDPAVPVKMYVNGVEYVDGYGITVFMNSVTWLSQFTLDSSDVVSFLYHA